MTDSLLSHRSETKSKRLDPPHDLMLANSEDDPTPWLAMAGRDPNESPDQLDRQTSELLAYVQQQNDEIDARQAELNAKLAQLDNELRNARLRSGVDKGSELLGVDGAEDASATSKIDAGIDLDEMPSKTTEPPQHPSAPQPVTHPPVDPEKNFGTNDFQEFEEVERLVAQFSSAAALVDTDSKPQPEEHVTLNEPTDTTSEVVEEERDPVEAVAGNEATDAESEIQEEVSPVSNAEVNRAEERLVDEQTKIKKQTRQRVDQAEAGVIAAPIRKPVSSDRSEEVPAAAAKHQEPVVEIRQTAKPDAVKHKSVDSYPQMLTNSHLSRIEPGDIQAMATSLDASEIESERRLLAERKIELDRRKTVLQRMQDDTQALHREALEMRLVTEQLWIEISGQAPADHVNELVASLRSRLDEHYTEQQGTIDLRREELVGLKELIERKQEDLRDQSNQLQQWVETRHDEIKSFSAEVDAREMLLDRREHRMREEFSKWEATRSAYQTQLQGLLSKLDISTLGGV